MTFGITVIMVVGDVTVFATLLVAVATVDTVFAIAVTCSGTARSCELMWSKKVLPAATGKELFAVITSNTFTMESSPRLVLPF